MGIEQIVEEAADTLRNVAALAGVPVIVEAKGDVDRELQAKVARQSACIMVGWNGFTPQIQGETAPDGELFGTVTVAVSVFEKPVVNRAVGGRPTIMEMAKTVALELHNAIAEGMDAPLYLKRITGISELTSGSEGVVTCDVEFETKTGL